MSGIATIFLWHDYFCFCLFVCLSGFVQSLEFLKKSWNLQTSFTDLEESGKDGKKSGVFCFENCNKCIFAKWSFFQAVKSYLFRLNENIQSHLLIIGINTATSTEFEIYFYVHLPLGQPQDLVWLPIEYLGCPEALAPVQAKKLIEVPS